MRDPLDLGNLLVLQRDESGAVVQDDVAEVLEPSLLAPELREVIAGYLDLRTHGNLPHASAGEVGMGRRLDAFDRREPRGLYDGRGGGGEGKGCVVVVHTDGRLRQRICGRAVVWVVPCA